VRDTSHASLGIEVASAATTYRVSRDPIRQNQERVPVRIREFLQAGRPGTLFSAFLYFDLTFAVWVLNSAMAPYISQEFGLSDMQKGFMISVPVMAGALMRLPLGVLAQYIGRKTVAQLNMGILVVALLLAYFLVESYSGVVALGALLGLAGASFGVALSLGAGWYPPQYKGLAMGIAGAGNSGAVLAVLFAPPLATAFGWQSVYAIVAMPLMAAMLLMQLLAKEPPDLEQKKLADYVKMLVDRDVWVFNLLYMLTFGGYIGLTSFLPTLFHDHYHIDKQDVGKYSAVIIVMASILRIAGGWIADRLGGIRVLLVLCGLIVATTVAASTMPASPWMMVAILVICFSAMGAGNGAVFQLVPLRFQTTTAVAGSLIGEMGALAGGFLPIVMGLSISKTGSFSAGFLSGAGLSLAALAALLYVIGQWTSTWVGAGGKAIAVAPHIVTDGGPQPTTEQVGELLGTTE
jgi:NNP family nitrate/nitrite transporter-like MFS transporter